jgi:hypothetical protein
LQVLLLQAPDANDGAERRRYVNPVSR